MNIFVVNKNPKICASILDDLRLNKMILETAQLLSCAYVHLFDGLWPQHQKELYKVTHVNHPCSIWARKSVKNYVWLTEYFERLVLERSARTRGKSHLSYTKLNHIFLKPVGGLQNINSDNDYADIVFDFNCTDFKHLPVFEAYEQCLITKWNNDKRKPTWLNTTKPYFYNN
jgi:Pyrimidine dimer DNA glycosylase